MVSPIDYAQHLRPPKGRRARVPAAARDEDRHDGGEQEGEGCDPAHHDHRTTLAGPGRRTVRIVAKAALG